MRRLLSLLIVSSLFAPGCSPGGGARDAEGDASTTSAVRAPLVGAGVLTEAARIIDDARISDDLFGQSVALSGDTILVGARGLDVAGENFVGAVYVYRESGGTWSLEQTLMASDRGAGDGFGASMAIAGDLAFIGAPGWDETIGGEGTVYIFSRTGTSWTEVGQLPRPSSPARVGRFGDDLDFDGSTLVVGAPTEQSNGSASGAAYVYTGSGTSWSQNARLVGGSVDAGDEFGEHVAVFGDVVAAASWVDDAVDFNAGAVWVFERDAGTWSETAELLPDASEARTANFGFDIALSAGTLAVGAQGTRSVHLFEDPGTGWAQLQRIDTPRPGIAWGRDVTLDGDCLVVGSYTDDELQTSSGAAFLYQRVGGSFRHAQKLVYDASLLREGIAFVTAVEGSRVITGARGGNRSRGAVDVFDVGTPTGDPCAEATECASGFCVDGVCCDRRCGGGASDCMSCRGAETGGVDGVCLPRTAATVCRTPAPGDDACHVDDTCDGFDWACPVNGFAPEGTLCREVQGECDVEERCTGAAAFCPFDEFLPRGEPCRDAAGLCDVADTCNGFSAECADQVREAGFLCRPPAGLCDVDDLCDGVSRVCADERVAPGEGGEGCAPYVCGGEVACPIRCETSEDCVAGAVCFSGACALGLGPGESCSEAAECATGSCVDGVCCDAACGDGAADCQSCLGALTGDADGACAPITLGTMCRASAGACDPAEACDGSSTDCPGDVVAPPGAPGTPACAPYVCGGSPSCAEVCEGDAQCAEGAACVAGACVVGLGPGAACAAAEECATGFCVDGVCCDAACGEGADDCQSCLGAVTLGADGVCAPSAAGTLCREAAGQCDAPEACDGARAACPEDAPLDDGAACDDGDECSGPDVCQEGACVGGEDLCAEPDAGPPDAGPPDAGPALDDAGLPDAGSPSADAGGAPEPVEGCACRAAPGRRATPSGLAGLLILGATLVARRRRRRR